MNDKRYYWLKLEEDYFDNKIQKALNRLPSGKDMLICYLKMQLKYLNKGGLIEFKGIYDSIEDEIALDIDEDVDLIRMTLALLTKWNVIEECQNNSLFLSEMQGRIGSKTDVALRVEKHRKQQELLQCNTDVTKCNSIQEKRREDKEIEKITTRDIYTYIEENFNRTISPVEYEKVEEWLLLFNEEIVKYAIELSVMNGKKTMAYVDGILKNWKGCNYTTLEECKSEKKGQAVEEQKLPHWVGKEYKEELLSKEDEEELKKMLEEFV